MTTLLRNESPTPTQEGMLFHSQFAPGAGVYVQQLVVAMPEAVDDDAMRLGWKFVAGRHAVLRTRFARDGGELVPTVADDAELPAVAFDADAAGFADWLTEDRRRGFDPSVAPLARVALARLGHEDYRLVFTFHHALLDGRSHRIVLEEAFAAYEAFRDGCDPSQVPSRPFADHLDWLRDQPLDAAETYFRALLPGFRAPTPLPGGKPVQPVGDAGRTTVRVPAGHLRAFAQRRGLTLAAAVQGAWAVALGRHCGEDDVVFGTTRSGRKPEVDGVAATVGLLVNTVPVRARPDPDRPLVEFLRALRQQTVEGRAFDPAPPTAVHGWSDVPRGAPLYESVVAFENGRLGDELRALGGAWAKRTVELFERPHYPLALSASAGSHELELRLHYDRARVDDGTAGRFVRHVATLLVNAPEFANRPLRDWPMLTDAERRQLHVEWNDTAGPYPADKCVHHLVEDQVARTPDAVATIHEGVAWTFRQLNERANCLAWHLRGLGVGRGSLVAVCMNRSAEMVVAALGVMKAGAAYVPIDPATPKERIAFLLADTKAAALVTQVRRLERLPDVAVPVVCIDADWPTVSLNRTDRPPRDAGPDDTAYVLYTSGSTGAPKGVVLRHRAVVNTLDWVNRTFGVGPGDRVLWVTSFCFDLSVYDTFGVLAAGGSVRVATGSELRDPERLVATLGAEPITLWDSAPPLLAQLAPHFGKVSRSSLRLVLLSGDWIPVTLPDRVRAAFPGAEVVSLGGATEAAIWSNYYRIGDVDPAWTSIPYGRPIRNARYHLLDHHGQPAPVGVPAELYIGGVCLADGYWNRPELTAERFVGAGGAPAARDGEGTALSPLSRKAGRGAGGEGGFRPKPSSPPALLPQSRGRGERLDSGRADTRLYRTGDSARYWPDGTIELLGRVDHQVKVRGFRVEPGEVEAALAAHPNVAAAVVAAVPEPDGGRELVAYVVPAGRAPAPTLLRRYLAERLPPHLVPAHFVTLAALPLNANGKVDRTALPVPRRGRDAGGGYVAPRDALEGVLAAVWAEVLGVGRVGIHDDFFDLGGHSLKAAEAVARVRQRVGRDLPLAAFFREPTVAACRLALGAEDADVCLLPRPQPDERARFPASPTQRQLWFLHRFGQPADVYEVRYRLRLAGRLDAAALARAMTALVERHAALRTRFAEADGQLWQVVEPPTPVALPVALPRGGFDLERGPLWRVALQGDVLTWSLHHLVADGHSMPVLVRELAELYAAEVEGRPAALSSPATTFGDYCRGRDGCASDDDLAYWRERLTPLPLPLNLPATFARPKSTDYRGGRVPLDAPASLSAALIEFGRREGVTPFVMLLAAFQALLYRVCGQDDIAVGVHVSGRHRPDSDGLVGPLLNTLVYRADLADGPTYRDLLARTDREVRDGDSHQDVAFDRLVRELHPHRDAGHQPLFRTLFELSPDVPPADVPGGRWTAEQVSNGTARHDLSLVMSVGPDGVKGSFEYAADLFDEAMVRRLAGHFQTLLAGALARPETPVAELPLLTAEERAEIVRWNATAAEVPVKCVHELIAERAAAAPGRVAVRHDDQAMTYGELVASADRLARVLRARGVGPDVPVALFLDRTPALVVAALAVWKAGGTYLPLDPAFPAERLASYVSDAQPPVVVADAHLAGRLPLTNAKVLWPDAETDESVELPAVTPDNLAYLTYTSGPAGTPKGVMACHRGLTNVLSSLAREPGLSVGDRVLALTSLAFDAHAVELWLPLVVGATVELVGREAAADGRALARKLRAVQPTLVQATPATWRMLVNAGWEGSPQLTALCGAEPLPADLAAHLLGRTAAVWNLYGPAETTVLSTIHRVADASDAVAIGRPIANTTAHVLDRNGRELPVGVPGELAIGGAGVARGYLGQPELTAARFGVLPTPTSENAEARVYKTGDLAKRRPDGTLELLGRIGSRVRVGGPDADPAAPRYVVPPRNDIEQDLVEVWEDVLNVRPVGVTDDFFDLGGDSSLAANLIDALHGRLGHDLPLAALHESPTVEALAAAVQRRLEAGEERCLVPLRPQGSEPPLFMIGGVGGHAFTFHKFARLLGDDRPAYGMRAIGADGREEPPDRIPALAARYVEEIEAERPTGPVVLGGYSVGALIAFEVACQLQAKERTVGPVAVFDMTAPGYPRKYWWPRRALIHLRNALTGRTKAAYLRQRLAAAKEWSLRRLGLGQLAAPPVIDWVDALPPAALRKVWAALRTAQLSYWPARRFAGRVLLFKAAVGPSWPGAVFDDPNMGWGRWADGVETTVVAGNHLELFREPNLQPMADAMRRQLARQR